MRACLAVLFAGVVTGEAGAQWPQWGGAHRNFRVDMSAVAAQWPADGPRQLWKRSLGDGYTSVAVDDGRLYTCYRRTKTSNEETVAALDADNGGTIWEYKIPSPTLRVGEFPFGPNATMSIAGDRVFYTGVHAELHCIGKLSGKQIWMHKLGGRPDSPIPDNYGYTCSPLIVGENVIVTAEVQAVESLPRTSEGPGVVLRGGPAAGPHTIVAFDQTTGKVAWTSGRFVMGHASPMGIELAGQSQLVLYTKDGLFGVDPVSGEFLWHHAMVHENTNDAIMTPLWNGKDLLVFSTHGSSSGSRAVRLTRRDGKTVSEEVWHTRKVFFGMHAPVLVDGCLVGSKGNILLGVDIETGERLWYERGYEQGASLFDGDRMLFLEMSGRMTLATVSREGIEVRSQFQAAEAHAFTPPTLVGKSLYVRDRWHIMAYDLQG